MNGTSASKICRVCTGEYPPITYKNYEFLSQFLTERGMIKSRKLTGLCSKHHRQLAKNIKRARHLGLLPFTTISAKIRPQELKALFESSSATKRKQEQSADEHLGSAETESEQ